MFLGDLCLKSLCDRRGILFPSWVSGIALTENRAARGALELGSRRARLSREWYRPNCKVFDSRFCATRVLDLEPTGKFTSDILAVHQAHLNMSKAQQIASLRITDIDLVNPVGSRLHHGPGLVSRSSYGYFGVKIPFSLLKHREISFGRWDSFDSHVPSVPSNEPTDDVSLQSDEQISSARMSPACGALLSIVMKYLSMRACVDSGTRVSGHSVFSVT